MQRFSGLYTNSKNKTSTVGEEEVGGVTTGGTGTQSGKKSGLNEGEPN